MAEKMTVQRLADLSQIVTEAKQRRGMVHWSELQDAVNEVRRSREECELLRAQIAGWQVHSEMSISRIETLEVELAEAEMLVHECATAGEQVNRELAEGRAAMKELAEIKRVWGFPPDG